MNYKVKANMLDKKPTKQYCFDSLFKILIPNRTEFTSKETNQSQKQIWYTDGSLNEIYFKNLFTNISYTISNLPVFQ